MYSSANEQAWLVGWLVFFHDLIFGESTNFKLKPPPGASKMVLVSMISMLSQQEWDRKLISEVNIDK